VTSRSSEAGITLEEDRNHDTLQVSDPAEAELTVSDLEEAEDLELYDTIKVAAKTPAMSVALAPAPTPRHDDEHVTPLTAAVEATTGWLKRVSHATTAKVSSAYAAATRSDIEEAALSSASTQAPVPQPPWPVASPPEGIEAAMTADPVEPAPLPTPAMPPVPIMPPMQVKPLGTAPEPIARPDLTTTGNLMASVASAPVPSGPRRARLVMSRVDPWSAMKLSFLMSFALGIMGIIAAAVLWFALDGLQVFARVEDLVSQVGGADSAEAVMEYFAFARVLASAMLVGVVNVFLLTALGTIGAFLYNIVAALVGGLHVNVTDE